MSARGLSGGQATLAIARLAIVRAVRGKALWIAAATSVLPLIVVGVQASLGHSAETMWQTAFHLTLLTLPIVPSILVGPSLSDELEDKTSAYLWSRALPRWSIIAGKLAGLAPIAAAIAMISLGVAWLVMGGPGKVPVDTAVRGLAGVAAPALVASALVAALATLVPRHAVAVSVVYLLFVDKVVGELPIKLRYISVAFGGRSVAGLDDLAAAPGALSLLVVGSVAVAIAITRIGRME